MKRKFVDYISKGDLKDSISRNVKDANDDYSVFGGWLIVFVCSLLVKIAYSAYNAYAGLSTYFYVDSEASAIVALELLIILFSVILLIVIRFRSYKILYLIRFLYISCVLFSVLALSTFNDIYNSNMLVVSYANFAWIGYLFKSRRVRHYYYRLEEVKTNNELEHEKLGIVGNNSIVSSGETRFQANTFAEKLTLSAKNPASVSSQKPSKKVPLCVLCGMPIDVVNLVCTGCGKKYIRRKKAPPAIDSKTKNG